MMTFSNLEKYFLALLILISTWLLIRSVLILSKVIQRGNGKLNTKNIIKRLFLIFLTTLSFLNQPGEPGFGQIFFI